VLVVSGARGADDAQPSRHGELGEGGAHAAGRAVDQQRRAGGQGQEVEAAGRRLHHHAEGGGLLERHAVGDRFEHPEHGVAGERSRAEAEHPVAGRDPADAVAHLVHHAGGVEARHGGERLRYPVDPTRADLPVPRVDAGRPDGDAHLAGAGVRFGDVAEVKDIRLTALGEEKGQHRGLPMDAGCRVGAGLVAGPGGGPAPR